MPRESMHVLSVLQPLIDACWWRTSNPVETGSMEALHANDGSSWSAQAMERSREKFAEDLSNRALPANYQKLTWPCSRNDCAESHTLGLAAR